MFILNKWYVAAVVQEVFRYPPQAAASVKVVYEVV